MTSGLTPTTLPAAAHTGSPGPFLTVPNAVTLTRTVVSVGLGAVAVAQGSLLLLGLAYAVYWIGDMLDGWAARLLDQETRAGAVFDIVSDRACTSLLCVGLLAHLTHPAGSAAATGTALVAVAAVFLLSFMVLDTMLSLAFLCWPVLSPNHFHLVDETVWRLNWSPPAKALNTAGVVVAVALGLTWLALVIALAVVAVKLWSLHRVGTLLAGREALSR